MPRYKLTIEYDGAIYSGWQRQENGLSVQEALEGALFAMTAERVTAHGAGRTDAGVHAKGQVANFKTQSGLDPGDFQRAHRWSHGNVAVRTNLDAGRRAPEFGRHRLHQVVDAKDQKWLGQ